jgi:hypothetical protein
MVWGVLRRRSCQYNEKGNPKRENHGNLREEKALSNIGDEKEIKIFKT